MTLEISSVVEVMHPAVSVCTLDRKAVTADKVAVATADREKLPLESRDPSD